ncbi:MAG TPA: hypothetical protein VNJ51_11410 [Candidatus Dormibacteraeota bacterium]|nr:hypothetical protein [Candidatus Dormibacteraeota bacterium]
MGLFGDIFGALGGVARIAGPILTLNPATAPLGLELSTAGSVAGFADQQSLPIPPFFPGNLQNAGMDAGMQGFLASQGALFEQQLGFQNALSWRSSMFDEMMNARSESMREQNVIRDVQLEQRRADNQATKKFIQSISE